MIGARRSVVTPALLSDFSRPPSDQALNGTGAAPYVKLPPVVECLRAPDVMLTILAKVIGQSL
jgi:hypothetical protein